jgi:hypothetical protein
MMPSPSDPSGYIPQTEPGVLPRASPSFGPFLLISGIFAVALGLILAAAAEVWFFMLRAGSFSSDFDTLQWGQAAAEVLIGIGILLVGLGWTLQALELERDRTGRSARRTDANVGYVLVLLGALIGAASEFLSAAIGVSSIEKIVTLENALGPGWLQGGPGIMLGVGLLIAGVGVLIEWGANRKAAPRS